MNETIKETVVECMNRVAGLTRDELQEAETEHLDLVGDGILDSLSIVALLTELEAKIGKKLNISNFQSGDFSSVDSIAAAVSRLI